MATLTLELITSNNSYSQQRYIDLSLVNHVHHRIEIFQYLDDIKSSAVGLDYFESNALDSKYNIVVTDKSYQLPANSNRRVLRHSGLEKVVGASYSTQYSEVLITNQTFIDELNKERPLFYKHILPSNTVEVQIETISEGNFVPVDTGYRVDLDSESIYTNYQNFFDQETGAFRLYFVISTDNNGVQTRVLLSPVSVVREATWQDIDLDTGELIDGIGVYTKERTTSGYTFYLNESDTYWVKPIAKSLLNIRLPVGRDSDDSWYLRVTNGDVTSTVNGFVARYWVPEYYTQPYQPSFPYIFSPYDKLLFVAKRVLSATRTSLAIDPANGRHVAIYIYDFEGNLLKVWTTNQALGATRYSNTDVFYESDKVLSWDNSSGILIVAEDVLPSWQFYAEYYWEADDVEVTSINLNPILDSSLLRKTLVFYVVPNAHANDRAVQYLIVENDGVISYTSQSEGIAYPNLQLTNVDGSYNTETIVGIKYISDLDIATFVKNYSVGYSNLYNYLILAEVNVQDIADINDCFIYDVRKKGDALVEPILTQVLEKNPKVEQSVYSLGRDGQVLPSNNVVVIQVPFSLSVDDPDSLRPRIVQQVKQFLPVGTYPIIEWVYPWSEVSADISVSNQVTLTWSWEGPDYTYTLYKNSELIYQTSSAIRSDFTYTDAGLSSGDIITYEVRITDSTTEYPAAYILNVRVK